MNFKQNQLRNKSSVNNKMEPLYKITVSTEQKDIKILYIYICISGVQFNRKAHTYTHTYFMYTFLNVA